MERELASLQSQVKSVEETYGVDNLHLTVAKSYVAKLLANARVVRWLAQNRQEYLGEFQAIAEIEVIGGANAAAEWWGPGSDKRWDRGRRRAVGRIERGGAER